MNVTFGEPVVRADPGGTIVYLHGIHVEGVTKPALFSINLTTGAEKLIRKGGEATRS